MDLIVKVGRSRGWEGWFMSLGKCLVYMIVIFVHEPLFECPYLIFS